MNETSAPLAIGVLALQGAFARHVQALEQASESLGLTTSVSEVRTPEQLTAVDALVVPGGESTVMSKLLITSGLRDPLAERLADGMPVFGTCAGMILLSEEILDPRSGQSSFGAIDLSVRRNGYGRQIASFEADLEIAGLEAPFRAVFIRAPIADRVGDEVEVLATIDDTAVLMRQGPVMVTSFHPELTPDTRLHDVFLRDVVGASRVTDVASASV